MSEPPTSILIPTNPFTHVHMHSFHPCVSPSPPIHYHNHIITNTYSQIRNYFVAAGQNAVGIASAAGMGRTLAEWVAGGGPSMLLSYSHSVFLVPSGYVKKVKERAMMIVRWILAKDSKKSVASTFTACLLNSLAAVVQ